MTGPRPPGEGPSAVRVFFYGNHACPFTYLARTSLHRLAAERPLEVVWRPLAASPVGEPGGHHSEDPWAEVRADLEDAARARGVPLRFPDAPPDPRPALEAAEFARDLGTEVFRRLQEALFRACFREGRPIDSREVLLAVGTESGLDREGLAAALEDGRYRAELEAAEREADRYGIPGTPTFLFGRFKLVGAAPLEEMRRAADRALPAREAGS